MRTVLDTKAAMSALLWRDKRYQLLESIRRRDDIHAAATAAAATGMSP